LNEPPAVTGIGYRGDGNEGGINPRSDEYEYLKGSSNGQGIHNDTRMLRRGVSELGGKKAIHLRKYQKRASVQEVAKKTPKVFGS